MSISKDSCIDTAFYQTYSSVRHYYLIKNVQEQLPFLAKPTNRNLQVIPPTLGTSAILDQLQFPNKYFEVANDLYIPSSKLLSDVTKFIRFQYILEYSRGMSGFCIVQFPVWSPVVALLQYLCRNLTQNIFYTLLPPFIYVGFTSYAIYFGLKT